MLNQMQKKTRFWTMILAVIIIVAIALMLTVTVGKFTMPPPWQQRPPRNIPGDIELYYTAKTVVSTVNITLLIFLIMNYAIMYSDTKSEFLLGLIIFSLVLLLHALSSNPLVFQLFGFHAFGLGPFAMLPDLFTLAALIVLVYLTFKY
ncbi:MAG: hypothetical protein QXF82_08355 [Nitrososphaeria archaeon]